DKPDNANLLAQYGARCGTATFPPIELMLMMRSAAAGAHRRKNFHYQEEWCPAMHTHRAFKILLLHVFNRTDLNDSGIVEKNIDVAIASENLGHGSLNLRTF